MGWMLLLVLVAVELTLLILSLVTQSSHRQLRAIVRITVFVVFVLLVLTGILEWSPRYYALGLLLLVFAAIGAGTLLRRRTDEGSYRPVWRFAGMVLVTCLAVAPAVVFPQHKPIPTHGPFAVAGHVETLVDDSRGETLGGADGQRQLTVEYWFPDVADARYPLVVFSHGATGIRRSNESLYRELASQGYVVASIDHTHHALFATDAAGGVTWIDGDYLRELREEDASADPGRSLELYREWMNVRMADIGFVIDHVREASASGSGDPFRLVDASRIGVIGHSLGGAAAVGVGRMRDDVGAVIALEAPFMTEIVDVDREGFVWADDAYPTPLLSVYSDSAWEHLDEWPQYAMNHRLMLDPDPDTFAIHLAGLGHLGLTDLSLSSPILTWMLDGHRPAVPPAEALGRLSQHTLAFLDAYLKGAAEFAP